MRQASREEAWRLARACAVSLLCLLAEVGDDWHGPGGGLGRLQGRQVGFTGKLGRFLSLSFISFCFLFFCSCLGFIKNTRALLKILKIIVGTF